MWGQILKRREISKKKKVFGFFPKKAKATAKYFKSKKRSAAVNNIKKSQPISETSTELLQPGKEKLEPHQWSNLHTITSCQKINTTTKKILPIPDDYAHTPEMKEHQDNGIVRLQLQNIF